MSIRMMMLVVAGMALLPAQASAQSRKGKAARPAGARVAATPNLPAVTGPEYIGTVEAVVNGQRIDLERTRLEQKVAVRVMGFGGASVYMQAPGDRSPVRLPRGGMIEFVTRVAAQDVDPVDLVHLYRVETRKKGWRRVKLIRAGISGASSRSSDQVVALSGRKHGTNFYKLTTLAPLEPGEYLILVGTNPAARDGVPSNGFLFGID